MNDILRIEEIQAQFPSEWVLIDELEVDESTCVRAGRVVFHSPNREDVYRKTIELRLPHFAVRYCGPLPENLVLFL